MRKWDIATSLSLMLVIVTLSGCVSEGGEPSNGTNDDIPVVEDFQGLDYVECMFHEDLERCWNVFVPETVDLSRFSKEIEE